MLYPRSNPKFYGPVVLRRQRGQVKLLLEDGIHNNSLLPADGATGNMATEDLVYMLHGMDIDTGIELDKLIASGVFVSSALGKEPGSRLGRGWTTRGHGVGGSEKYY